MCAVSASRVHTPLVTTCHNRTRLPREEGHELAPLSGLADVRAVEKTADSTSVVVEEAGGLQLGLDVDRDRCCRRGEDEPDHAGNEPAE